MKQQSKTENFAIGGEIYKELWTKPQQQKKTLKDNSLNWLDNSFESNGVLYSNDGAY